MPTLTVRVISHDGEMMIDGIPEARLRCHQRIGVELASLLVRYVHVWMPEKPKADSHMRDEIRVDQADENEVIVGVHKEYAQIENDRPGAKPGEGPHNFGDRAFAEIEEIGFNIVKEEFDRLFGI